MPKTLILGFNGSPHKTGTTAELLDLVLAGAGKMGAETRRIDLYDLAITHEPGFYSEDPKKEVPAKMPKDGVTALYPDIVAADGLVFATPTYWANMSGVMKEFIEHLTALENDHFKLQGKIASFIAVSKENEGGVEMAVMAMVAAVGQMGVLIPPNAIMWHPGIWVNSSGVPHSWAKEGAGLVGENMVRLAQLLKERPIDWG